jgi:hypothetical protein
MGLLKRLGRDCHANSSICSTELFNFLDWIRFHCVHCVSCPEAFGQLQLFINNVDGHHLSTGNPGILNRQVAEAADTKNGNQVRGFGAGDFNGFVGGHTCTGQRRGIQRINTLRDLADILRWSLF